MQRIRGGDQEAFRKLFWSFYVPLREFVAGYLPPPSDDVASDIAQETLVKFWQRRENFDSVASVKSFLYNTARNAVLNELAHRRVVDSYNQRQALQGGSAEEHSDRRHYALDHSEIRSELIRCLRDEISALPRRTRQIMEMALQGNRNDEIAAILGIQRETVRTLKKSAHKKLRERLYRFKWLLDDYNDEIFS